jgi:hypothetical protein
LRFAVWQSYQSESLDAAGSQRIFLRGFEGRGLQSMNTEFEVFLQYNLSGPTLPEVAPGESSDVFHQHRPTLASAARDVEALAGAGDLDHARYLAKRVLEFRRLRRHARVTTKTRCPRRAAGAA